MTDAQRIEIMRNALRFYAELEYHPAEFEGFEPGQIRPFGEAAREALEACEDPNYNESCGAI